MAHAGSTSDRRSFITAVLATGAATLLSSRAAAAHAQDVKREDDFPFDRTGECNLSASDRTLSPRVRALIRIGEDGIARDTKAAVDAFFHPQIRFPRPGRG